MDDREFHEALTEMEPEDRSKLVVTVQKRVRTLSRRHLEIQERIQDSDENRKSLAERLADAERRIIEQADGSVEQNIDSIEDIEALPKDAGVEFDPELLAEVESIRDAAHTNYQTTADEGADLQAELHHNSRELQLHQEVLSAMEDGELSTEETQERLLTFFEESDPS